MKNVKAYLVATNGDFSLVVMARTEELALCHARHVWVNVYGYDPKDLDELQPVAYEMKEGECYEIA